MLGHARSGANSGARLRTTAVGGAWGEAAVGCRGIGVVGMRGWPAPLWRGAREHGVGAWQPRGDGALTRKFMEVENQIWNTFHNWHLFQIFTYFELFQIFWVKVGLTEFVLN
jgi:hypothetical protein